MESAYLYVRVSTDEQRKKGYSLPEQEDRLIKYCEFNNIKVKGIYREDFSAKNFNRPEWKKLIITIKKGSSDESSNILFVKWDRFSRNIEYAYEMIGILRKHRTTAMAIDQPIDFEIPESSVMLAVYLAIPEAENGRRALNTSNGMRRAKQLGRFPNRAPVGYINLCAPDGRKYIAPKQPEADLVKWSFQQLAKNAYRIEDVRKMVDLKGLKCSSTNFWRLLRNPVYCGYVSYTSNEFEGRQLVKAVHQPIISEELFKEIQKVINTKRKVGSKKYELNEIFALRKFMTCPVCKRKLTGSFSQGARNKYPYYHCTAGCKTRFKAGELNFQFEEKIQQFGLLPGVTDLFRLILEDVNVDTQYREHLNDRKSLLKQIADQEQFIAKARKLFVIGKIQYDDFSTLKKEYNTMSGDLKDQLEKTLFKLSNTGAQLSLHKNTLKNIFKDYKNLDVHDKRKVISFITPEHISPDGLISLRINNVVAKILSF